MIRGVKDILGLSSREDQAIHLSFEEEEKEHERRMERPTVEMLHQLTSDNNSHGNVCMNTIELINKLRLPCNLRTLSFHDNLIRST